MLKNLFTTYGLIELKELQEKEDTLRQKIFEIAEPLIIMYNEVNELQKLATSSGNHFTPKQLIMIRIQLIKVLNDFEKGLTTWCDLLPLDQTSPRFQTHFETTRASLHRVRGVSMRNIAYHQQVNAIKGRVLQETRPENVQLVEEMKATEKNILRTMHTSSHK